MRKIDDLREIQSLEIQILDYVVNLCKKNNLQYYLAGGTLLGAIRHQGFIPWDNDIDISMPRPDYRKLIYIMSKNPDERYKMLIVNNKNNYYYPFVKIVDSRTKLVELTREDTIAGLGLYIDIFPLDTVSEDYAVALKQFRHVNKWGVKIAGSVASGKRLSVFRKMTHLFWKVLFQVLNREKCLNYVESKLENEHFGSTGYIASTYGLRNEREIISADAFADTIEMPFENRLYKCPIGYEDYLTKMYGNYMELPPENERITPHDIDVFLK